MLTNAILAIALQTAPSVPLTLYAEAREIAADEGDALWPGFAAAPFQILLIDGEYEFLVCGEGPGEGFEPFGTDPATGCEIGIRDRQFPPGFLASFPAVDGIPTIVVGMPEATGQSESGWRIVLLHEHLHQMQDAVPGAYQAALDLDLHDGDTSGMWMLNYPFPYDDPAAGAALRVMAEAALIALNAGGTDFEAALTDYLGARSAFLAAISERDARYWNFQLWREGVARWTELELARRAGLDAEAETQWARLSDELERMDLAEGRRTVVYAAGAAEAELLERAGTGWRDRYWTEALSLGRYFTPAPLPAASSD